MPIDPTPRIVHPIPRIGHPMIRFQRSSIEPLLESVRAGDVLLDRRTHVH
jgi:hypothetical protein